MPQILFKKSVLVRSKIVVVVVAVAVIAIAVSELFTTGSCCLVVKYYYRKCDVSKLKINFLLIFSNLSSDVAAPVLKCGVSFPRYEGQLGKIVGTKPIFYSQEFQKFFLVFPTLICVCSAQYKIIRFKMVWTNTRILCWFPVFPRSSSDPFLSRFKIFWKRKYRFFCLFSSFWSHNIMSGIAAISPYPITV